MSQTRYVVVKKYLAGDDKYLGRTCVIERHIGHDASGRAHYIVRFEDDGTTEAFPEYCLRPVNEEGEDGPTTR